jgi:protein TonB
MDYGDQVLHSATQDRISSAFGVILLHAVLGYAFLFGSGVADTPEVRESLKLFEISLDPPPVEEAPAPARSPEPEGRAAPPGLKSAPSPIVAPVPEVFLLAPTPIIAAPLAGQGAETQAGASDRPGPGTGAGGTGSGTGSGGSGSGGGGGVAAKARQISGRIVHADYPKAASRAGAQGEVLVRFTVEPSGRVGACTVVRSSGNADLDGTTCRLIQQRYRFEPARDAAGRTVAEEKAWLQRWWLERD